MYGYVTSACWQIENVKTPSPYAVRSSETVIPKPNETPGKKHGRNSCSGSAGSMSPSVPYARKEGCPWWRCCFPIDATALSCRKKSYEPYTNKRPGFLRKLHLVSPRLPIAKNQDPSFFSSIPRPLCKDSGARNEPVPLQKS